MGKIKGWTKSRQDNNQWNYGGTINQISDGYIVIIKRNYNYFVFVKKPNKPEVRVNRRMLHTKEEARRFVFRYMRAHPRG